jgi:phosphatidylglycerophosphate synthase
MNSTSLIIPAQGMEQAMSRNIAGLTLLERLCRTARKAGITGGVIVITSNPHMLEGASASAMTVSTERELADVRCERCIVLKAGFLPDVEFLKALCSETEPGRQYTVLGHPVIFVCSAPHFSYVSTFFLRENSFDEAFRETARGIGSTQLHIERGRIFDVCEESDIPGVENELFQGLIKDTEGFMSRHVERRISIAISKRLVNTSITPNQMTIISVLIGIAGAACIYRGQGLCQVAGALLFLAHSILDGCDGEIARIKFMESRFGGILDFWGDNVVHAAIFWAIGQEWHDRTGEILPLVLSWLAVISTFGSAALIYYRTMRLKDDTGPMYTSVTTSEKKNGITKIADFLSRRDFIYLVVILAAFRHLDWFLIMTGIGSPLFFITLIWLYVQEKKTASA